LSTPVDNSVDALWTTTAALWTGCGRPWTHLWATRPVHPPPPL
jgi:hypothetical protein